MHVAVLIALPVCILAVRLPLPKATFQEVINLPLANSEVRGSYNVVLVAEEGHTSTTAVTGICVGIAQSFNTSSGGADYMQRCEGRMADMVREARGLDMQHDPR